MQNVTGTGTEFVQNRSGPVDSGSIIGLRNSLIQNSGHDRTRQNLDKSGIVPNSGKRNKLNILFFILLWGRTNTFGLLSQLVQPHSCPLSHWLISFLFHSFLFSLLPKIHLKTRNLITIFLISFFLHIFIVSIQEHLLREYEITEPLSIFFYFISIFPIFYI